VSLFVGLIVAMVGVSEDPFEEGLPMPGPEVAPQPVPAPPRPDDSSATTEPATEPTAEPGDDDLPLAPLPSIPPVRSEQVEPVPSLPVDEDRGPGPDEVATTYWYGWQILLVEGAGLALLLAGVPAASLLVHFVGCPVVHWAHGRGGAGFVSLGLRVGFLLGGPLVGVVLFGLGGALAGRGDGVVLIGALIGLLAGAIAGPAIDIAVIAREPVAKDGPADDETRLRRRQDESAFEVAPFFKTRPGGGFAGVQLVF
jgi:hypothetical protein